MPSFGCTLPCKSSLGALCFPLVWCSASPGRSFIRADNSCLSNYVRSKYHIPVQVFTQSRSHCVSRRGSLIMLCSGYSLSTYIWRVCVRTQARWPKLSRDCTLFGHQALTSVLILRSPLGTWVVWKHHPHFHHNTTSSRSVSQAAHSRAYSSTVRVAFPQRYWKSMAGTGLDPGSSPTRTRFTIWCGR